MQSQKMRAKKSKSRKKPEIKPTLKISLYNLHPPKGSHKPKKLLGRGPGSGHGKTSTRGSKGQTSRSGKHKYLGFEGGQTPLIRRIPKRGFTSRSKKEYQLVHLRDLDKIRSEER